MNNLSNKDPQNKLDQIEGILSAGYNLDRLANESTIERSRIENLLSKQFTYEYTEYDAGEDKLMLEIWLADYELKNKQQPAKTPTFCTITALLAKAHNRSEIISITGGVGVGKTEACRSYVKDNARGYDRPGAFYIEFKSADKKTTAVLERILSGMLGGQSGHARQSSALMRAVCSMLKPGDFMVLDECNHLVVGRSPTIDIVRDIFDSTGIGIALLGNQDFDKKVYGERDDFDALASRAFKHDFPISTESDIDSWIQWKNLGKMGKPVRDELARIGKRPGAKGGLRTLNKLVDDVMLYRPGEALSVESIRQFLAQYGRL